VIGSGKWFSQGESQVKTRYQIDKQRAVQQFRRIAEQGDRSVQLVIPLKEVLDLVQRGLMNLALRTFTQVAEEVMDHEVTALVGPKNQANPERGNVRWGSQAGYCVVGGQKIPLERPRVRNLDKKEVPLGSYELLQRASLMEESVWKKIMHGLTTRRYSQIVEELEQAYGIRKSTISEHFIEASRQRLDKLLARPLGEYAFCAMLIDGTPFGDQQLITAMGVTVHGQKLVLGLRQGATENATVVRQLLADLQERGVDFEVPRLYVLDGGKALFAGVRQAAGKAAVVQRCQIHKIRNVIGHLPEEHHGHVRQRLYCAYNMREYSEARRLLDLLHRDLMDLNPSAARSLEEGLNETLTIHRLRIPPLLRTSFASTNLIESAFSMVETVCRNVKRWQGGDQYLRWVGSGLIYAESRWYRVQGHREISVLVKELELAVLKQIPLRHATVA
jgi:transposase-like protein